MTDIGNVNLGGHTATIFSKSRRPRARRYPFVASIELTNLETETQLGAQTRDLSLFGCSIDTQKTLPGGTKVRIKITHAGGSFIALGRVVYARYTRQSSGMGIAFTYIEAKHESLLENWIAERRDTRT